MTLGASLIIVAPAHSAEPSPEDRAALIQLAERMDRAWTAADAGSNAELFTIDATARFGNDPIGRGRAAIRDQFRAFFEHRPPGLRHVTSIESTEQLGSDLAMWDAEVRVERQGPGGEWMPLTRIRNVTLVARQLDGWRIKAVRAFPVSQ